MPFMVFNICTSLTFIFASGNMRYTRRKFCVGSMFLPWGHRNMEYTKDSGGTKFRRGTFTEIKWKLLSQWQWHAFKAQALEDGTVGLILCHHCIWPLCLLISCGESGSLHFISS